MNARKVLLYFYIHFILGLRTMQLTKNIKLKRKRKYLVRLRQNSDAISVSTKSKINEY